MDNLGKRKKGVGYMLEAIIAAVTIFIFAFGQSPSEPAQDWSTFQDEIAANDLSYTLKETGDINESLKRQHTGSLQTAVSTMTEGQLEISGTVDNLPLNDASIGFSATNHGELQERWSHQLDEIESADKCAGDLKEIENQTGTPILKTEDPGSHDGVVLYFADTGSQVSDGGYDTLYVDNKTRCQFSASEGPIYIDEFFRWNTSTPGEYEYYDFKSIDPDPGDQEFTYYNATLPFNLKTNMSQPINGIRTTQSFDTFNMATKDLDIYDLIIIRREEAIEYLNEDSNSEVKEDIKGFMENKPVLILANLSKSNVENGFIDETGLEWMNLSYNSEPSDFQFSDSIESRKIETYFKGSNGDLSNLNLSPGGNISSSNSESLVQEEQLLYSENVDYNTTSWTATNNSMEEIDPDNVEGEPKSACYSTDPSALTEGEFSFANTSNKYEEYYVLNAQMGETTSDCGVVRSLNIDLDRDGDFNEDEEGPFLNGEEIIVENRKYKVNVTKSDSAEFKFVGNSNIEVVNYRKSFREFDGEQLARIGFKHSYSEDEMKLISSTLYWLLGDTTEFGQQKTSSFSTTVLGSINQNVYMPYKLSLRWS